MEKDKKLVKFIFVRLFNQKELIKLADFLVANDFQIKNTLKLSKIPVLVNVIDKKAYMPSVATLSCLANCFSKEELNEKRKTLDEFIALIEDDNQSENT